VWFPSPAVSLVGSVFRRSGLVDFSPEQLNFLQFGRGVDTTRLREDFGYVPEFRTIEAFDDFVRGSGLTRIVDPQRVETLGLAIRGLVARGSVANA
jgi:UDP-glucose 4-epimerase